MENQVLDKSLSESERSCTVGERCDALVAKLAQFYSVMGHRPEEPGALAIMAEILVQSAPDREIDAALTRCARECRYPVRLPDILQRIPGQEIPQIEAESRAAWDVVTKFVRKYVGNDVYGNYGPEHGWYPNRYPKLSDRILDTVRRTGGWKVYACMTTEDFPFVQKRFFEEYAAWTAVELITDTSRLIEAVPEVKQLAAKPIDPSMRAAAAVQSGHPVERRELNAEPLTPSQIADRREMLRQQAELMRTKYAKPAPTDGRVAPALEGMVAI